MNLKSISLENFRGIENLSIDLDGKSTVFYGINGAGKTSILKAINLLYINILNKILKTKSKTGKAAIKLDIEDIAFGKSKCKIGAEFFIGEKAFYYERSMIRKDKARKHKINSLDEISKKFNQLYLEDEISNMPIFINYGVNRVVMDVPLRIRNTHIFNKEAAFDNAIESKIDFRTFFEWFRYQEDYENQERVRVDKDYEDVALKAVKEAVTEMLGNVQNLRVERNPLEMKVDKYGIGLNVIQLSDGEKCTLAMFGDLARRLSLANPTSENPLMGEGVVLIDEIDLHMHPEWQRRVLTTLRRVFPNIQFIVTTHSPQVLGEINQDYNIFSINKVEGKLVYEKVPSLNGWDSNYILECFMGTASLNEETKRLIERLYEKISHKNFEVAEDLANNLADLTDEAQEDVVKARILIRRGRSQLEKNN